MSTDRNTQFEQGVKIAAVLAKTGDAFLSDDTQMILACKRVNAMASAAAHKIGDQDAAVLSDHVRGGVAMIRAFGSEDGLAEAGDISRIAYATVLIALELGTQVVAAGLGAGLLTTNGQRSNRAALAMRIVDRMYRQHLAGGGDLMTPELLDELVEWGRDHNE